MNPAARYAAAIEILDTVLAGSAAEKALTNWARSNRYAGSGDRHAVRDIVFDALRCKRSFACLGGAETGRGIVLGGLRANGVPTDTVFTGTGYAPPVLTEAETSGGAKPDGAEALDCPDWLEPDLRQSLGPDFEPVMQALQTRAPVFLRVNTRKSTREAAMLALRAEGIETTPNLLAQTALEVTLNPRKVQTSKAYLNGSVELQDAASQAIVEMLDISSCQRILDYCAGGGGKTLAMAGKVGMGRLGEGQVGAGQVGAGQVGAGQVGAGSADALFFAHDAAPNRMKDLHTRAKRAGVKVDQLSTVALSKAPPFDLVLADAPCSGSGSWRRAPEAKWSLSAERLAALHKIQADILDAASKLVAPNGTLAYATCSLLKSENDDQVAAFQQRNPGWELQSRRILTPLDGGDGFFVGTLKKTSFG